MNPNSGKLYSSEEVEAMSQVERDQLKWISKSEWSKLIEIEETERPRVLKELRARDQKARKKKRKVSKDSRKKNR